MADQLTHEGLREWRKEAGLTQPEFADELGVSKATIARWEQGDEGAPWKLLALARDGWQARNNKVPLVATRHLTEEDVRRIAQEEMRRGIR